VPAVYPTVGTANWPGRQYTNLLRIPQAGASDQKPVFRFPERHFFLETEILRMGWSLVYRCCLRCEGSPTTRGPIPAASWLVFARLLASQIVAQLLFASEDHHPDRRKPTLQCVRDFGVTHLFVVAQH